MKFISIIGLVTVSQTISINSVKNPWGNGIIFNSGNITDYKAAAPTDYRGDSVYEADNFQGAKAYRQER